MKKPALISLMIISALCGFSQIAAWDFTGYYSLVTVAATLFQSNLVTVSGMNTVTRGPGAASSGGANSFRTLGFQNNGISTGNSDYFQVTLQAAPGYRLSLATIDARFNGSTTFFAGAGVTSQFAYSLDGANFSLIGSPVQSPSLVMAQVSLAGIPELQNVYSVTTVTLRYYASGQTTTGGWGFHSPSAGLYGLAIGGNVTPVVIAPPTVQTSGLGFTGIGPTGMGLSWTPGNGDRRIVKINTTNSFTVPADGTDPAANAVYGGAGEQVVYNSYGSSLSSVTGLVPGTTYWFRAWEYNGAGILTRYDTAMAAGNPASAATMANLLPPVVLTMPASGITDSSAVFAGRIPSAGGGTVQTRGTVWSLVQPVTIADHPLVAAGSDTGIFTQLRSGLPPAARVYFAAFAGNGQLTAVSPPDSLFTLAIGPTAHAGNFTALPMGATTVKLSWNPASPGADRYLVVCRAGGGSPSGLPADGSRYSTGTSLADGTVVADISSDSSSVLITGLSPGTTYAFALWPYAWDGQHDATANYLTVPAAPWAMTTTLVPLVTTYHWTGASGPYWNAASSWNPQRTAPSPNDILVFDAGGTWTLPDVPAQTVGQLKVTAGTAVNLKGAGTLTLQGDSGPDLLVETGCQLNLAGSGMLVFSLGSGVTGSVAGSMAFSGAGHRLLATDSLAVTFSSGGSFRAEGGFTGNPFGTTALKSVVFESGSTYSCVAGGHPFGAAAPASVVIFRPGSLYRIEAYIVPSFGGRTYGDFEMNYPGSITATGSAAVSIGDFRAAQGTFYFNVTGTPGHTIRGNITVAHAATLIFSPSSDATVQFSGQAPQTITGTGSLMAGAHSILTVTNPFGVTLGMDADLNQLKVTGGGIFTIANGKTLTLSGDLTLGL